MARVPRFTRPNRFASLALVGVLVSAAAGCTTGGSMATTEPGSGASSPGASASRFERIPAPTASDVGGTPTPLPMSPTPPATLSQARRDAVAADLRHRGVDPSTVTGWSVQSVTWPDGSWGCPEPGVMYTQALVPGMRVVVAVGAAAYDYRFGRGDTPALCTSGAFRVTPGWSSPNS